MADDLTVLDGLTADGLLQDWRDARDAAFREARAARLRELRGRRGVRAFDARGIHPYSAEIGRVQMLEELLGEALPAPEKVDPIVLRRSAEDAAEADFAADVRERGAQVFADARRADRGGA